MSSRLIAALFVDPEGAYSHRRNVDLWDEARDARKYRGPYPVVAHPPCNHWSMMALLNHRRWGWKIGDDGGCFKSALKSVRKWGGVLEHPASSLAWEAHGLPRPVRGQWLPAKDGWVCVVSQRCYGHRARKLTWLYYVGKRRPPDLDWSRPRAIAQVGWGKTEGSYWLPPLSKTEASATPPVFRDLLISLARRSN